MAHPPIVPEIPVFVALENIALLQAVAIRCVRIGHFIVRPTEQGCAGRDRGIIIIPNSDRIEGGQAWASLQRVARVLRGQPYGGFAIHRIWHVRMRYGLSQIGMVEREDRRTITEIPSEYRGG